MKANKRKNIATRASEMRDAEREDGVSIIIPVYNVDPYLEKCIRSVMEQSYGGDVEIICVDDGSTDNSYAILKRLAAEDSRITLLQQENAGQGVARNRGLEIAQYEWIMFADSDDYFNLDAVESLSKFFCDDCDLIVFSARGFQLVDDGGDEKREVDSEISYRAFEGDDGPRELTLQDRFGISATPWCKVFRRSIIKKYGLWFPSYSHQDVPFSTLYYMVARRAFFTSAKYYNYLKRADSTTGATQRGDYQKVLDLLLIVEYLYDELDRLGFLSHNRGEAVAMLSYRFMQMHGLALRYVRPEERAKIIAYAQQLLMRFELRTEIWEHNYNSYLKTIAPKRSIVKELKRLFF